MRTIFTLLLCHRGGDLSDPFHITKNPLYLRPISKHRSSIVNVNKRGPGGGARVYGSMQAMQGAYISWPYRTINIFRDNMLQTSGNTLAVNATDTQSVKEWRSENDPLNSSARWDTQPYIPMSILDDSIIVASCGGVTRVIMWGGGGRQNCKQINTANN